MRNSKLTLPLTSTGRTPVYLCARYGHAPAIKLLHTLGADIDCPRDNGETPAFAAASGGHDQVVQLLANLGSDTNRADNGGEYDLASSVVSTSASMYTDKQMCMDHTQIYVCTRMYTKTVRIHRLSTRAQHIIECKHIDTTSSLH